MLQIEPQDHEHFIAAWAELIESVEDPKWRVHLTATLSICAKWQDAGLELPWGICAILYCVVGRIVFQHIYQGSPLVLPKVVIAAYIDAGDKLELPLFECENDAYALPRSFAFCPLCGGRVGLGAYAKRRARVAACN